MKSKILNNLTLVICGVFLSMLSNFCWAQENYPCVLKLAKSNCWKGYQVTVQPMDADTGESFGNPIVLEKDVFQVSAPIACKPRQNITFKATISPAVWAESRTSFSSTKFWLTPKKLPRGATEWIATMCFSKDFSTVPMPLAAGANCACDFAPLTNTIKNRSEAL